MSYEINYCDHKWKETTEAMRGTFEGSPSPEHQNNYFRTCERCLRTEESKVPFDVNPNIRKEYKDAA